MPYKSKPQSQDYFEQYEELKPWWYWGLQQDKRLEEILGWRMIQWIEKEIQQDEIIERLDELKQILMKMIETMENDKS